MTTFGTTNFGVMPGNDTCTLTFPRIVVKEKDLFGAVGAGVVLLGSFAPSDATEAGLPWSWLD